MVFGREAYVYLAVLTAALLVLSGLLAPPARAQQPLEEQLEGLVIDLVVDVDQGECGERGCAENRRPVTFDARLEVDEASSTSLGLEPEDIKAVNEALAEVE